MAKAFKIESYIRRNTENGAVEIDLLPDDPTVELTSQQIVDCVVELVIWNWDNHGLEAFDPNDLDS